MKKIILTVIAGAAITTAALAFAGKQSAASAEGCGSCCTPCCAEKADT